VIVRAMVPTDARPNTFGLRINFVPMEETDTDERFGSINTRQLREIRWLRLLTNVEREKGHLVSLAGVLSSLERSGTVQLKEHLCLLNYRVWCQPIMRGGTKRQVAPQRDNTRLPRIHGPVQLFELLARWLARWQY